MGFNSDRPIKIRASQVPLNSCWYLTNRLDSNSKNSGSEPRRDGVTWIARGELLDCSPLLPLREPLSSSFQSPLSSSLLFLLWARTICIRIRVLVQMAALQPFSPASTHPRLSVSSSVSRSHRLGLNIHHMFNTLPVCDYLRVLFAWKFSLVNIHLLLACLPMQNGSFVMFLSHDASITLCWN